MCRVHLLPPHILPLHIPPISTWIKCVKMELYHPFFHKSFADSLSYLTGLFFTSGSLAVTTPTSAPTFISSWTSMMVPSAGWKMGGSSTSETLTRTIVWSRNEPKSTKRGSTCLFTASTTTLCVRLVSKSSGWKTKHKNDHLTQEHKLFEVTSLFGLIYHYYYYITLLFSSSTRQPVHVARLSK